MNKLDFMKECMTDPALVKDSSIPMDTFKASFCLVCANRQCVWSVPGGMSFDRRAVNWKKDLFDAVPRASDSDASYNHIRSKVFLPIQGSTPEISLIQKEPVEHAIEATTTEGGPLEEQTNQSMTPDMNNGPTAEIGKNKYIPNTQYVSNTQYEQSNTPFAQGVILPGGKPAQSVEPSPPKKEEVIIEPGGSFTFGGSDE